MVLVDLQDLQLEFGDFSFCLRYRSKELPPFPVEPRCFALELIKPCNRHESLFEEIADANQFVLNEIDFFLLRGPLCSKADDFLFRLIDALLELRFLACFYRFTQLEKPGFRCDRLSYVRCGRLLHKLIGEFYRRRAVAFGLEPSLSRRQLGQRFCDDREIGASDGVIKPYQKISRFDVSAILYKQFADHAAGWVLNLLDVRLDHNCAGSNESSSYFHCSRPEPNSEGQEQDDQYSRNRVATDRVERARRLSRCDTRTIAL